MARKLILTGSGQLRVERGIWVETTSSFIVESWYGHYSRNYDAATATATCTHVLCIAAMQPRKVQSTHRLLPLPWLSSLLLFVSTHFPILMMTQQSITLFTRTLDERNNNGLTLRLQVWSVMLCLSCATWQVEEQLPCMHMLHARPPHSVLRTAGIRQYLYHSTS